MSCVAQQINMDTQTHKTNTQEIEEFEQTANNQSNSQENLSSIFKAVRIVEQVCSIYSTDVNVAIFRVSTSSISKCSCFCCTVCQICSFLGGFPSFQVNVQKNRKSDSPVHTMSVPRPGGRSRQNAKTRTREPAF